MLLSIRAACNVLQYFSVPADQIKAVQSLSSASTIIQAGLEALPPDAVIQPDSPLTPGKQQHPRPLQEPPCRLASASKQPAAASKRLKLLAQAFAQSAPPATQDQMGVDASRDATEALRSLHQSGSSNLACHAQLARNASQDQGLDNHGLPSQDVSDRPRLDKPGPCTAHGKALSVFHLLSQLRVQATAAPISEG